MAPATTILEQELREVNALIQALETEAGQDHEAAEQLVEQLKASGKNPLLEKDTFEQVDAAYKVGDGKRQQAEELRGRRDQLMARLGKAVAETRPKTGLFKTAAEAITGSPEYQRLVETGPFNSPNAKIDIPGVEILSRDELAARLAAGAPLFAVDTPVVGGPLIDIDQRRFPPVPIPVRPLRLTDMITVGTTESDQIIYVQETIRTDAAAETALGTAYGEADYEYAEVTASVRDIGHWTPAHRSQLADQGQLQTLVEGRLEYGVQRRLEDQIVNGDGTGVNLKGILNTTGIGSVSRDVTNSEKRLDAIHRGITKVRLTLFDEPDAIGIHPTDYENLVLEKATGTGNYLLGPPNATESPTVWGKKMIVTAAFPLDTALVGNYRAGAVVWVRSGVSTRATDSHSDFFVKRMIAVLAEMRAAFAAWQPLAFCSVDVD